MDRAGDSGVLSNSCPLRERYFHVHCPKLKFHFWPLQTQIPQPGPHSNPSQCSSALTWSLAFTMLDRLVEVAILNCGHVSAWAACGGGGWESFLHSCWHLSRVPGTHELLVTSHVGEHMNDKLSGIQNSATKAHFTS